MSIKNLALLALCGSLSIAVAVEPTNSVPQPDNAAANSAPVNSTMKSSTADGQSSTPTDLSITQQIRKSVVADKHLSMYAHNVKIVTVNGSVTLNGVVRSEAERRDVETKAQAVVGKDKVTNHVKVAPAK